MEADAALALVDATAKRSGLVWVRRHGAGTQPRPVWHVWLDGAAYVLTGGIEQPLPDGLDAGDLAEVTARSKDNGARLIVWQADVSVVDPADAQWDVVVPLLQAKRLNSPDGDRAPARWAAQCRLLRLTPTGAMDETPDRPSDSSHATAPSVTPATTPVPRPWHLGGRRRRRPA